MCSFICSGCFVWVALPQKYTVLSLYLQKATSVNKTFFAPRCSFTCTPHFLSSTHKSTTKMWFKWKDCFASFCSCLITLPLNSPFLLLAPSPIISSLLLCLTAVRSSLDRYIIISLSFLMFILLPHLISLHLLFPYTSRQVLHKPAGQAPFRSTWSMWTTMRQCWYPGRLKCASVHAQTPGSTSPHLTLMQTRMSGPLSLICLPFPPPSAATGPFPDSAVIKCCTSSWHHSFHKYFTLKCAIVK